MSNGGYTWKPHVSIRSGRNWSLNLAIKVVKLEFEKWLFSDHSTNMIVKYFFGFDTFFDGP